MEIDLRSLEIGNQYQYENKYHFACVVTVIAPHSYNTDLDTTEWYGWTLRNNETIFGNSCPVGEEFNIGYREGYKHYFDGKFKEVGSETDYLHWGGLD